MTLVADRRNLVENQPELEVTLTRQDPVAVAEKPAHGGRRSGRTTWTQARLEGVR